MKKKLKSPKPKPFLASLAASSGPSLIRHLASVNASVRYESLKLIQSWLLSEQKQIPDAEMNRIWKGLFYCVWHSDKAPAQAQLINRLSSLLLNLDPLLSLQYFSVFLVTLRREWNGIDHLRLDKFYLLIRKFVNSMFSLMKKFKWELEYLLKFVDVLEERALLCQDKAFGNGVNYHIVSVFLDELKGFNVPVSSIEVLDCLFRPFLGVMKSSLDKVLVVKVRSCIFDVLLRMGKDLLERESNEFDRADYGKGELILGIIALKMNFSARLYETGSAADCIQGNRKVIFEFHQAFMKLEKELETSGIDIDKIAEVTEIDDDDGEEAPELVPVNNGVSEDVDLLQVAKSVAEAEGNLKKKKKAKKMTDKKSKKKKKEKKLVLENGLSSDKSGDVTCANRIENENLVDAKGKLDAPNYDHSNGDSKIGEDGFDFSEAVISNLQAQFEKVAAEMGFDGDGSQSSEFPQVTMKKKRKRGKTIDRSGDIEAPTPAQDVLSNGAKSSDKGSKKVRFAMKNNLIWKPHSPLPPQDLRIPPSVTPRGSALKKGVPPGPIREIPAASNKSKLKKGRKVLRATYPATKFLRKARVISA